MRILQKMHFESGLLKVDARGELEPIRQPAYKFAER
jgi:hypothetical protein